MATAKKLPSGSWRCRVFSHYEIKPDGTKRAVYESFTVKDPSRHGKRECERLAAEWSVNRKAREVMDMTVQECIRGYIDAKEANLSPATVSGYEQILRTSMEEIRTRSVGSLTAPIVQAWINILSAKNSPKYVRNANGLLSAALEFFGGPRFKVALPPPREFTPHVPCDEEIRKLIDYIVSTTREDGRRDMRPRKELLLAVMLAAFGSMRRGEICALTREDVDPDALTVRVSKDIVKDKYHVWVTKPTPKTNASNRVVELPPMVFEKMDIYPEGKLIRATPDQISNRFRRAVKFSGAAIPFRFHDLRHYYVSIAHALGIPDAYIMEMGGWKTETTMKRVYRATLADRSKIERDKLAGHFVQAFGREASS